LNPGPVPVSPPTFWKILSETGKVNLNLHGSESGRHCGMAPIPARHASPAAQKEQPPSPERRHVAGSLRRRNRRLCSFAYLHPKNPILRQELYNEREMPASAFRALKADNQTSKSLH
jgi:hypothetical protein